MADLIPVSDDVVHSDPVKRFTGESAATITAGLAVYRDPADGLVKIAHSGTQTAAAVSGIALNDAAVGHPVTVATGGDVDLGDELAIGEIYVLSDTPGGIKPVGDIGAEEWVTILGIANAADALALGTGSQFRSTAPTPEAA